MNRFEPTDIELADSVRDQGNEYAAPAHATFHGVEIWKIVTTVILAIPLLASVFPLKDVFSSPDTYASTVQALDEKESTVMALTGASAAASAAISALPGDAGTPIAEKMIDLSSTFMIVLAAILLEKYLLTTLGFAAFAILFPVGCALIIAWIWTKDRFAIGSALARIASKVILLGLVLVLTVPSSVFITNRIEDTYQSSIDAAVASAEEVSNDSEAVSNQEESQESQNPLDFITSIPETISSGVEDIVSTGQEALNNLIEALAVMIVTSCVIPLLVLAFFLWAANLVLGINVSAPMAMLKPGGVKRQFAKRAAQGVMHGGHGHTSR